MATLHSVGSWAEGSLGKSRGHRNQVCASFNNALSVLVPSAVESIFRQGARGGV